VVSSLYRVLTSPRTLTVLVLLGVGLRLWAYLADTALYLDEILLSYSILNVPLADLLTRPLPIDQVAPPGFLLGERFAVTIFGHNEHALRLFPFVCAIVSLLLFCRLAKRALTGAGPAVALFVFAIGSFATTRIWRAVCYIALAVWFWSDYLMLFSVGALFYDFHAELRRLMRSNMVRVASFAAALFFFVATEKVLNRLHFPSVDMMQWQMLSATLIVALVLTWPLLQRWIGGTIGQTLGRISFTLYLVHLPIICSMTSWLIITLPHSIAAPASIALTIAGVFAASLLLCQLVDQWPTMLSRAAGIAADGTIKLAWEGIKRRYSAVLD